MKVSVIIPTFRPKVYIWECLDSLVAQTFPKEDFEVIIVLNGCVEPWKSQIDKYIACKMQDMNVNFINIKQGGVSNARNTALNAAIGEYVTFIDDDDYVSPGYLSSLFEVADVNTISICDNVSFDDKTKEIDQFNSLHEDFLKKQKGEKYNIWNTKKYFSAPVRKLINKNIIGKHRFDPKFKNGEDTLFCFLISYKIKYVTPADNKAIYYRRCRTNSAHFREKTRKEKIILGWNLFYKMSCYYFKHPTKYNIPFFITRLLGSIKVMFL